MEEHGMFVETTVKENERNEHETYIRMAIDLAEENVKHGLGGPFGAVICKDGKIIAKGSNKVVPTCDPTAHAEMTAIRQACQQLKTHNLEGCVIYTSCEPCPMCLGAIYWAHLEHIYFSHSKTDAKDVGFDDHFIYEELARELHERRVGITQLLKDESKAFSMWRECQNKTHY
ncbi:unnamed protein product [Adineta steineri]|uniref:CMP/dCMP-type deaminase domain-containing protein n=1 Tax=Adineta steineri TaxID=433720 RepID=A0A815DMC0_9BILA|nr:unnamed protein product [Adineta steineri]CAF1243366.1 unnamed protein product [Adineta steineri]CAF1300182.1 unnamed protein product [Adineta steineri]CAF3609883.1 unnamed protein product [Adineta steineri]CAF3717490.1 unnamed protein product [Adineta steineri]